MLHYVKEKFITSTSKIWALKGSVKPQLNVGHHSKYKAKQSKAKLLRRAAAAVTAKSLQFSSVQSLSRVRLLATP